MKGLISTIVCVMFLALVMGCNTASYFITPNEVRNVSSTVFLRNGEIIEGELNVTSNLWGRRFVKIRQAESENAEALDITSVEGYKIDDHHFDLKEIPTGIGKGFDYSFMRRLTPANSRIQLYEHSRRTNLPDRNNPGNTISSEFYIQLPKDKAGIVWNLGSRKFYPQFRKKMAWLVRDCPPLAKKVADRKQGYDYFGMQNKAAVLLRIIDEYNNCNKKDHL